MTRNPTSGAVLVVLLVAASGLAGAATATDANFGANDPAPLAQETTTTDDGASDETTDNAGESNATVTFDQQPSNGSAVVVNETTLPEGGFVVIYAENGTVIGNSSYLEPGEYENVTVELDVTLAETQVLVGVAHADTNDDERFDFNVSEAEAEATATTTDETTAETDVTDSPYLIADLPVTDVAYIVIGDADASRNATETDSERRTAPLR